MNDRVVKSRGSQRTKVVGKPQGIPAVKSKVKPKTEPQAVKSVVVPKSVPKVLNNKTKKRNKLKKVEQIWRPKSLTSQGEPSTSGVKQMETTPTPKGKWIDFPSDSKSGRPKTVKA